MRKILLLSFIAVFMMSVFALAVEKPQAVIEKPGLNAKEKSDAYSPTQNFGLFTGKYSGHSNPSPEAIYLNEGFEGTFPPAGWTLVNAGAGFIQTNSRFHTGTYSAYHNDDQGEQDDWLVTPAIDLTGSVTARLNFWQNQNYNSYYELHQIYVTTDTTGIMGDTSAWTAIYEGVGTEDVWEQIIVDLSAYDGQTIYLGFYYSGNYADEWYIDDVIVEDTPTTGVMELLYSELIAPPTLVGSSVSDTFGILRNSGVAVLNITSITGTNPDFAVTPTSGALDPGDTLFVIGTFTPSTTGYKTGLMIISGDDPGNPTDTIQVTGGGYTTAEYAMEEFNDWPFYPYNFSQINANEDVNQWAWYRLITAGDTNYVAGMVYTTSGNDDYLVTPPIPVISGDFIAFNSWVYSASYPETWEVLVSTTDNQASSFTINLGTVTSSITSPVLYYYDLSAFDGQTIYVAIHNISVDEWYQWVDDVLMPMPNYPMFINEIYYDSPGTDAGTFTEIFGKPGSDLTGYLLDGNNGNGGVSYRQISLDGYAIPEDGFFVVGQDATVLNVDFITADVDWQNGPDNVLLIHGTDTLDAIGYGDFSAAVFVGEGNPIAEPYVDYGLGRYPDGFDTNDNSLDFYANYLTPGELNYAPSGIIGGGASLAFDTTAVGAEDTLSYRIYNNGGAGLLISSIVTSNPVFTAEWPDGATDTTIAVGAFADVNVIFAPAAGGAYVDSMTINSNDLLNGANVVDLTGVGELAGNSAAVVLAAQIGGDSQYRSFWVNGSWDSSGVYDPNWGGPMVELKDNGVAPDVTAGDNIFTGSVILMIDLTNTYSWWTGSENNDGSFLDNGTGFNVIDANTVYPDTLVVDGSGGINEWVISLPGAFNGWDPTGNDMTRRGTKWSIVIPLEAGTYEYKYAVMHQWDAAYGNGGIGGGIPNYSVTVVSYGGSYLFTFDDADNSQTVEPYIPALFFDDFEAYTAGVQLALQDSVAWTTWSLDPGSAEDPFVSDAHAYSGVNSVVIAENNDLVKTYGSLTTGKYEIAFYVYIPTGKAGYFNSLSGFTPNAYEWAMECYFDQPGTGRLSAGSATPTAFNYPHDTWFPVEVIVDLNTDQAELHVDNMMVHSWQWTLGSGGTPGSSQLRLDANDFFGATANDEMYFDDFSFTKLDVPTGIVGPVIEIPTEFMLDQNYPNPFNPTTTIKYALKENAQVILKIYNMLGQEVRTLINARQEAGYKQVVWDGLNNYGSPVASGVYIYQIQAGNFVKAHKMILMK